MKFPYKIILIIIQMVLGILLFYYGLTFKEPIFFSQYIPFVLWKYLLLILGLGLVIGGLALIFKKRWGKILSIIFWILLGVSVGIPYLISTINNFIISEKTDRRAVSVSTPIVQPTDKVFPTQTIQPQPSVKKVTVQDLATNPNAYLNVKVQVTGKLINTARSYFPTRPDELVLTDGTNNFQVTAWLPFEVPPSLPGSSGDQPRTLGFYFDKIITVQGIVKEDKVEKSFYLDVIKTIEF